MVAVDDVLDAIRIRSPMDGRAMEKAGEDDLRSTNISDQASVSHPGI